MVIMYFFAHDIPAGHTKLISTLRVKSVQRPEILLCFILLIIFFPFIFNFIYLSTDFFVFVLIECKLFHRRRYYYTYSLIYSSLGNGTSSLWHNLVDFIFIIIIIEFIIIIIFANTITIISFSYLFEILRPRYLRNELLISQAVARRFLSN